MSVSPSAAVGAGRRHKVLLFIPNLQQGGAERQILELMTKLPERFEVTLCLYEDVVHYREYLPAGEPRNVLGVRRMGRAGLSRLVEVLARERPHIFHSYRDKANFWARLAVKRLAGVAGARVPITVTAVRSRAIGPLHLATEWHLSKTSDRVLANSEGVRRELIARARVNPGKIQILHNFIDLAKFRPPDAEQRRAARQQYGLHEGEVALLLPGRIGLQKHQLGLVLALRALARAGRLPAAVKVLLAGRNRDRAYAAVLAQVITRVGIAGQITALGPVKDQDMIALYHAADALVLPSLWEGLPNVVLEAHASGLPAVVSHAANIDGLVLDGESGFEVTTFHPRPLAEAIARMVSLSPETRRQMGARGRAHIAATFGADRVLAETVRLYDTLLAERGLG
jgi:glycosyltransferase involved in cell wall biosynthesis